MRFKMVRILASIFDRFWLIWGGKLGWEIDQKSIQKGIENMIQKMSRFERVLGRFWADFKSAIPHFRVGPAECAGPGGDYRGGAGSR